MCLLERSCCKLLITSLFFGRPRSAGQAPSMSPNARKARIGVLEGLVDTSSTALVSMASQLSEAEERQRMYTGVARWQHIRSLGDAKNLLQLVFNAAAFSRSFVRCKDHYKNLRLCIVQMLCPGEI